jgi:cytochrome c6
MKRFLSAIAVLFVTATLVLTNLAAPALAGDLAVGKSIFGANCAACHIGGGNVVNAAKTLKQADLEANGKDSLEAIVAQVTNGNGAMPAFKGKLSPEAIENVASYVLDQAQNGW